MKISKIGLIAFCGLLAFSLISCDPQAPENPQTPTENQETNNTSSESNKNDETDSKEESNTTENSNSTTESTKPSDSNPTEETKPTEESTNSAETPSSSEKEENKQEESNNSEETKENESEAETPSEENNTSKEEENDEENNSEESKSPLVITNADGTTFTITPDDLNLANYKVSDDKKTITLGGRIKKTENAVADGYDPETYTLTGKFDGQIVVYWDEVEIVLADATITNAGKPAIYGKDFKFFITAKAETTNKVTTTGQIDKENKYGAIQGDKVEFGGKGTCYIKSETYHGVKAKKVELKGSGTYYFEGTEKGAGINCNSLKVKEEKSFTANFSNSKNGIKADNYIDIASGTFNFENLKNALKTDTSADDEEGDAKEHYIKLTGGTFNYKESSVDYFEDTEEGKYTHTGASINKL